MSEFHSLPLQKLLPAWDEFDGCRTDLAAIRALCLVDRYYLLVRILGRVDMLHPWVYDRCREVEESPDGHLDLWGREHHKSGIITQGGAIQEVLKDQEIRIGIFSHTKGIARKFLSLIKRELESNVILKAAFEDILWSQPEKEAPGWSLDGGLIVKRKSNPKEATIEAHGLTDGQPTSAHFPLIIYDDVVTRESVNTPEQIKNTTEAWELSDNLSTINGRKWHVGTRYSYADTYEEIMKRGAVVPRLRPATDDGTITGKPVYFPQAVWNAKLLAQGESTIACHGAGAPVLMADWSYKPIEDVRVGDFVVGYEIGVGKGQCALLVRTEVVAINCQQKECFEYTTECGSVVRCTEDHKWWTKRSGTDGHSVYAALGSMRKRDLKRLYRVSELPEVLAHEQELKWQYLAGIMDGEGTVGPSGQIVITQSGQHNPEVHARIGEVLEDLGLKYSKYERSPHGNSKGSTLFILKGGRDMRHRFLLNAKPAKARALTDSLYCHIGGKSRTKPEKVVSRRSLGTVPVYNIQTITGNYIAWGFASKNCQMLQNPLAGKQRMFNVEDLQTYEIRPNTLTCYVLCDPARSKKKDSANTAIVVIGLDYAGNKYLLDGFNHKMDLQERWEKFSGLYWKWRHVPGIQSVRAGYEKFGAQSDLDYFGERMKVERRSFEIVELAWPSDGDGSKVDRVQRLGPDFRGHKFFLPYATRDEALTRNQQKIAGTGHAYRIARPIKRKDGEGAIYNVGEQFKVQAHYFPFGGLKDLVDAASRIYDMEPTPPIVVDERSLEPEFT